MRLSGQAGVRRAQDFEAFTLIKPRCQAVRRCGSAAIDLCLVADGTYEAYFERRLNPWDLGAGAAMVLGAGGRLSSLLGAACDVRTGHIVASNGLVHDELMGMLKTTGYALEA
jgi:myo-inositol-1(or 4)-monophosphatase